MNFLTSEKARARKVVSVLGAALGVLLFSVSLFSQANFGRILGTVTDQSGGVLSGAAVTIIDKDRGVARNLITDDAGEYNAPTLIPGTYTVRVEAKGFRTLDRQNIVLEVGKEVRVDLTPQPGEQSQTVTVTESLPLVETTNATLGGTLNNADIQDMPLNGRNYQNLLSLRPGVMTYAGGSPWTQSTNNSRPDESVWMLDGVLNVNLYDARPIAGMPSPFTDGATILPVDAIQEFNLMENPKSEFGWRPGAVVNVGIRSGTNVLHGSAYGFYRSAAWDARNTYNTGPVGGKCLQNLDVPSVCGKLPTQLKQFGGVIGGPIKKDKLFFFGGYEGLRSLVGNAFPTTVPAAGSLGGKVKNSMVDAINGLNAASVPVSSVSLKTLCPNAVGQALPLPATFVCTGGLIQNGSATTIGYNSGFPNTNVSNNGIGKMDYRINSKHTVNGMVLVGDYYGIGEDHPIVAKYWENGDPIRTYTVTANWIWAPSSRLVNEARFGWDRVSFALINGDANKFANGTDYALNTGVTSTGGFPTVTIGSFSPLGGWRGRPVEFLNPYYDFQDSVSYLVGKHTFKFGGEFAHIEADPNIHDTRGRIDFQNNKHVAIPGVSTGLEDFFAGKPSRGNLLVGATRRKLIWRNFAGFVQDDWRVTPKLTVNLGLRYSYVSPFHEANGLLGSFDPALGLVQQGQPLVGDTLWKPDHKDFSPRLGFAWDISGKGTTVVRGGFSRIYSIFTPAQFMQSPFNNFKGGSIGAVPTGGCSVNVTPCPAGQTFGGSIDLGSAALSRSSINWDPAIPGGKPGPAFPSAGVVCAAPNKLCDVTSVSSNLLTPYMSNWSLGVTHAFNNNLSLEVGYVGNHGSQLTGVIDLNQSPLGSAFCTNATLTAAQLNSTDGACNPTVIAAGNAGDPEQQARPFSGAYPYLRYINMTVNDARSNYHSLQATLTERLTHGLSFTAGYTYGHGLDNGSLNRFANLPVDSTNPGAEYGNSDFDIRHRLTVTATYNLPGIKGFGQLLEGWKLNSIVSIQGGLPWIVYDTSNDISGTGQEQTDRWDFFGNPSDFKSGPDSFMYCTGPGTTNPIDGKPSTAGPPACAQYSGPYAQAVLYCGNAAGPCSAATSSTLWSQCTAVAHDPYARGNLESNGCFVSGRSVIAPPKNGTFGNMGRNIFRDSGFKNVDFSVFKTFTYQERYSAQFRVELFNMFNHPIISNPYGAANGGQTGNDPSSPVTFGCGCGTPDVVAGNPLVGSGSSRVLQLGLKLTF
jgi:hypothetical protein